MKRNKVTHLIRHHKNQFLNIYCNSELPAKTFWNRIKNLGVGKSNNSFQSIPFSAEEINNFFCNSDLNNRAGVPKFVYPESDCNNSFTFQTVSEEDVNKSIFDIKSDAVGLDEINLKFVKIILPFFLQLFTHIFNFCIENSIYPKDWKIAKVIPIAKVKLPSQLKDLRPISILPTLSKAFEIILKYQIMDYLEHNNLLNEFQSGFRPNHSTNTALLNISDDIRRNIDNKNGTILVLLDFSSAFDSVNHDLLLRKLYEYFNFSKTALKLIQEYLIDRSQSVHVNDEASNFHNKHLSVPQGSVLGPILFSLFINDVTNCVKFSKCHIYADVLQLYINALLDFMEVAITRFNSAMNKIMLWSGNNL